MRTIMVRQNKSAPGTPYMVRMAAGEEKDMAIEPLINRLGQQFGELLPANLRGVRNELEDNLKIVLRDALARLDLLTRDEFDIQQTLLARTRSKVETLEQQVKALEAQLTALEDATVYVVPKADLPALSRAAPALEQELRRAGSQALTRTRELVDVMAAVASEVRLARFLLQLSNQMCGCCGSTMRISGLCGQLGHLIRSTWLYSAPTWASPVSMASAASFSRSCSSISNHRPRQRVQRSA